MLEKLKNKTVLIVDDDERNTFALSSYLEMQEMKILKAANGAEALEMMKRGHIDIVLLDMMMPVMDGYETLAAISEKEELKKIPVIAVTARAMKGDMEKCIAAGAWDYIAKPLELKLLAEKMTRWI